MNNYDKNWKWLLGFRNMQEKLYIQSSINTTLQSKKIKEDSLHSIPSPSVKSQNMGRKMPLRCKGKTLLGVFNKLLKIESNVLPLQTKQYFLPIIWIFYEDEGDGIEFRLPLKIFYFKMINYGLDHHFLLRLSSFLGKNAF